MILIDGKKAAAELREELRKEVIELKNKYNNFFMMGAPLKIKNNSWMCQVCEVD